MSTATQVKKNIRYVRPSEVEVSPVAQRELRPAWAATIATNMMRDKIGIPILSHRDDTYYVIDGQHRFEALRIAGFGEERVKCEVYEGLTEQEEAELFDGLNDTRRLTTLDRFKVRVTAGRERERDIVRTVKAQGLNIRNGGGAKGITAVAALGKVYDADGPETLGKALRVIRDAYGDLGMRSEVIEGVGLVFGRYNGELTEERAVERLSRRRGGFGGLMTSAEMIRRMTALPKGQCVAAAVVETINAGRGGRKLTDWFSVE